MPYKDPQKAKERDKRYRETHREQKREISRRWAAKHKDKIKAYQSEYLQRPEVQKRLREYYLAHREEILFNNKRNKQMKHYKTNPASGAKHRKSCRMSSRRMRAGVKIVRNAKGYFWYVPPSLWNGPFAYKKDLLLDVEEAMGLGGNTSTFCKR